MTTYTIRCLCGACEVEVSGPPLANFHCHCSRCRLQTCGVGMRGSMFPPAQLRWTRGKDQYIFWYGGAAGRGGCNTCHTILMNHPPKGDAPEPAMFGVSLAALTAYLGETPAGRIPRELTDGLVHCWYKNRLVDVHDGAPKFADLPTAFGGTGALLANDGSSL